jgi:hypothetical protein
MTYEVNCKMYDLELRNSVKSGHSVNLSGKTVAYISQNVTTRTASRLPSIPNHLRVVDG